MKLYNYEDFKPTSKNIEKKIWRETQFPIDCQNAYELGKNMVNKIIKIKKGEKNEKM